MPANLVIPIERIRTFCEKWGVTEFSLFGSALRNDFRDDSDVDVLLEFDPNCGTSYWDWPVLEDELQAMFGRKVDIVAKGGLRNPFRRSEILRTAEVIYAA